MRTLAKKLIRLIHLKKPSPLATSIYPLIKANISPNLSEKNPINSTEKIPHI